MNDNVTNIGPPLDDLISEQEVMSRWGHLFGTRELPNARRDGLIRSWKIKRGHFYTEESLRAYIANKEVAPCQPEPTENSNSEDTGSTRSRTEETGIDTGMTPELEKAAAALLEHGTSSRRNSNSPRSS